MNNKARSTVLACIDGSAYNESVVDYAAWVARTVANPLKLLHNIERRQMPQSDLSGNIGLGTRERLLEELTELEAKSAKVSMQHGKQLLAEATARASSQDVSEITSLQRHGSLADSLIEMEEEIRVLVLGVRGEDHEHAQNHIGSQLETVIRNMHRPVLIVNSPFEAPPQRIMLAYDGSESAKKALEMVATSPLYKGITCHVVHVTKSEQNEDALLTEAAERLKGVGLTTQTASLQGEVEPTLMDYRTQHNIDMTVMGAFGHSRLRELLFGSTTIKMLCHSKVPLLLLR
ncbi:MAG TPA: universal stress protein [Marinagarivorans sp.]